MGSNKPWQKFERSMEDFLNREGHRARRTAPLGYDGTDLLVENERGTMILLDCKYQKALSLAAWRAQVEADAETWLAEQSERRIPMIVHRRLNYSPESKPGAQWVTMTMSDLAAILR